MSDNGPHNQPPQNPYGGGEYGEGQPPYGPPPGGDPSGGHPPMPPGPHGGMPGQPGYGTGGQPGYGPQGPVGQPMYGGGQPPYGGPGGPVPPPQNGGGKGGSKASLWVVLGGGAVIIVLVVAVIVTLINKNGTGEVSAEPSEESAESTTESDQADDTGGDEEDEGTEGTTEASGEAPYSVPTEPCEAFTSDVESNFLLTDEGNKSVQDNTSSCSSRMSDPPEGNDSESYGALELTYSVPYSNSESEAEAAVEYERGVEEVLGQSDYSLYLDEVTEESEVDLGDESYFVVNGYDFAGEDIPVATLLVRTANLNLRLEYQLHSAYDQDAELDDYTMPEDVQDMMVAAGEDALAQVGS
ncbi:hypothetical protein [Nocardiopsis kunsanensis]|uniref:DUF3558 domain-containing protein n=1 Tax=Nocardiopsis kunsanensis TaxID=141693 RepID=A0A918X6U1_9ACTN|nr:hypothetical protein [Nocardiopsis kunsanensis]GHD14984.1 hypothetical protein GCM10007147_01610 [Nocardiopsis kunsanensis]